MDNLTDLILTMILTYAEHGKNLGFTKKDIDDFIAKYKILEEKPSCNERGLIIFWQKKYITNEQFAKYMEVDYDEGEFWLVRDSFTDLNTLNYDDALILDGEMEWESENYNQSGHDIKIYHWKEFNKKTLQAIIKFCIDNGFEIDGELMTDENTIFKNNDIYFNEIKLKDLLSDDYLEELIDLLSIAIGEAQDAADLNATYNKIKTNFINQVGTFKHKKVIGINKKGEEYDKYQLWINLSKIDFNKISDYLKDKYGDYDFIDESYGNLFYILQEMGDLDYKSDNRNVDGTIDKKLLNEYTQNRLAWG